MTSGLTVWRRAARRCRPSSISLSSRACATGVLSWKSCCPAKCWLRSGSEMTTDAIWITEADVVGLMDLKEAIAALEAALRAEARGEAQNMTKILLQYLTTGYRKGAPAPTSNLHALGGTLDNLVST